MDNKIKLKLFIWNGFCPDYSGGLAFAIAKDQKDAEKLVIKEYNSIPYDWRTLEIKSLSRRIARCVCGGG